LVVDFADEPERGESCEGCKVLKTNVCHVGEAVEPKKRGESSEVTQLPQHGVTRVRVVLEV